MERVEMKFSWKNMHTIHYQNEQVKIQSPADLSQMGEKYEGRVSNTYKFYDFLGKMVLSLRLR